MQVKKILNLTKHSLNFITPGASLVVPKSGVARCSTYRETIDNVEFGGAKIPVSVVTIGEAVGLPEEEEGTIIVVSGLTGAVMQSKRDDIYIVDQPVTDKRGRVIGCRGLTKLIKYL